MTRLITLLTLLVLTTTIGTAQTYNITENTTVSAGQFSNQISNATININTGVTLTINMDVFLQNVTFNGGNIIVNNNITFWSPGRFNNVNITFKGSAGLVTSGNLTITNSQFTFEKNSKAVIYTSVDMIGSRMTFTDNAGFEATGGTFSLKNGSSLVAGDGKMSSKAFLRFNGATLNEYDNSYVTIANNNNYYFNWSNYNTLVNNKSYQTTWNTLNCNAPGKNQCSAPVVYGPATLNYGGVSSSAILPVKLSAFGVSALNDVVTVNWTTDAETNAKKFDIERSRDGQTWTVAGTVDANGNTSNTSSYSFRDLLKVGGKVSYRLKMVDQDGAFEYSPIRTVNAEGALEMTVYPNPATSYFTISSKNGNNEKLTIQLINLNGQILKQVNGNGNSVVSLSEFRNGNYLVRVINANTTAQTFKLMIKK